MFWTKDLESFFNWMMAFVAINGLLTIIGIRMTVRLKWEIEKLLAHQEKRGG